MKGQLVYQGGTRRSRRIQFDLRECGWWIPSSQDCQRRYHDECDVKSCGCRCHKVMTFYLRRMPDGE